MQIVVTEQRSKKKKKKVYGFRKYNAQVWTIMLLEVASVSGHYMIWLHKE